MASLHAASDLRLALPPGPEAAGRARGALVNAGLAPDLEHTVTLLATELVANSVRHAGPVNAQRIVLLATLQDDFARVEVYDAGPGFDPEIRHEARGFGLRLVEKLSTDWGVDRADGCRVWFEIDRRSRRFDRAEG